ncbi:hypothetical protein FGB62_7g656 [Gracilaria domingensis]|nr:hypothetical protein FGB62_7g656 [Gracilaria domingensis]
MEPALNPQFYQIGYAGKDAVKECFENRDYEIEKVIEFIMEFKNLRGLQVGNTPLTLLKKGGFVPSRTLNEVLKIIIDRMKRDIATLSHEKLDCLLEKSFTYLTVPHLAEIPIATLERINVVDPHIWKQIVDNGLNDSPYTDLPLSIKKRIWSFEPKALDHEIDVLIDSLPEAANPENVEDSNLDRHRMRSTNAKLNELLRMLEGMGENEVMQVMEKMVERAAVEQVPSKLDTIANFYHDLVLRLPSAAVSGPNLMTVRKMAKFLDTKAGHDITLDTHLLKEIREAMSAERPNGAVALLVGSTYSRDFLAEQLVYGLISRRGPIHDFADENILKSAASHLRADPHVEDLTFLNFCNMKTGTLLSGSGSVTEAEFEEPFQLFFQLMMDEIHVEITHYQDNFYSANIGLPNARLVEAVQKGRLPRRVLTSYCLQQFIHANYIALSRYRLLLEDVLRAADNTTEPREVWLAYQLILKIIGP